MMFLLLMDVREGNGQGRGAVSKRLAGDVCSLYVLAKLAILPASGFWLTLGDRRRGKHR